MNPNIRYLEQKLRFQESVHDITSTYFRGVKKLVLKIFLKKKLKIN